MALASQKVLALVTGASRGIGREICLQLAQTIGANSALICTARSLDKLETLKTELHVINDQLTVQLVPCDMGDTQTDNQCLFEQKLRELVRSHGRFDTAVVIHNAGTVGQVNIPANQLNQSAHWTNYLQTNLVSMVQLNCTFLTVVTENVAKRTQCVNISSLLAVQQMPSFAQYCVGKSAREAYFGVLATENKKLRVLNYAPGPIRTDMVEEIIDKTHSQQTQTMFNEMRSEKKLLTAGQTVTKLINLLNEDTFQSAAHVDYFDIP